MITAVPPLGYVPTDVEVSLFAVVGVGEGGGRGIVAVSIGMDALAKEHEAMVVKKSGAEGLARLFAHVPK